MALDDVYQEGTDRVLLDLAQRPHAMPKPRPSAWGMLKEALTAPAKGVAQGVLQTARNANAAAGAAGVSMIDPREDLDGFRAEQALSRQGAVHADPMLRDAIEWLGPDPVTSTVASQVLQDAARLLTKVAGYAVVGGTPGAIVGTSLDEGATGVLELTDRGVDPSTALKVGAVRGATTAVGIAAPVAGRTLMQSAGIVAVTGPGTFIAEQALAREILERAEYPELAAEHDPFDPVGLAVSTLVPGVIGGAVHVGRARSARRAQGETPPASSASTLAELAEVRDAAHVDFQQQQFAEAMLAARGDIPGSNSHARTFKDATHAMDAGEALRSWELEVAPLRAQSVVDEVASRLKAVDAQLAALRMVEPELVAPTALGPVPGAPAPLPVAAAADPAARAIEPTAGAAHRDVGAEPMAVSPESGQQVSPALQRADRIAGEQPQLPVRMSENEAAAPAADLVAGLSDETRRSRTERRAFEAAVECAIRHGD